ncbi:unnamed protein product [Cyprideis torosa]|uniref:dolichyl-P-Man:Man5GlcNAc2-PP-dolichol alpha-1,3-mannosyltransferase n=1 Tax=Cyprideis torosa TaxID=163714 RepID=A0A7R8WEH5_9CRUS|nr:unnamed protein product [Cyprideis torosa]CAG0895773.1 unnamed protein product [Cyprideis torosa]
MPSIPSSPPRNHPPPRRKKNETVWTSLCSKTRSTLFPPGLRVASVKDLSQLLTNPQAGPLVAVLILLLEVVLNGFIISFRRYTEIDWSTYMQQVEMVLNGTREYSSIRGDTGPLPYPAGHVWIYTLLYFLTDRGSNVWRAQVIFAGFYLLTLGTVFLIYLRSQKVPPYVFPLMSLIAYRVHSIYVLRLFNDPLAMMFLYAAIYCFMTNWWSIGSLCYSLAVSVKMNILLFSPALLMLFLIVLGLQETLKQLTICALPQLVLAAPFLLSHPLSYVTASFNLGRVFLYKWTVNWRFLPEEVFLSRYFHGGLLVLHLSLVTFFALAIWKRQLQSYISLRHQRGKVSQLCSQLILQPLFLCNFIGVVCSRSLHYQFYVWYYHTIPYILWCTPFNPVWKLLIFGILEMCWNTYPSTELSSGVMLVCHLAILGGVAWQNVLIWRTTEPEKDKES